MGLGCGVSEGVITQREKLVEFFRNHGYQATLSQLLDAGFYKFTARVSELRDDGYKVDCVRDHDNPGRNLYTMTEPAPPPTWKVEPGGQEAFL